MKIKLWIATLALPLILAACDDKKQDKAADPTKTSSERMAAEAREINVRPRQPSEAAKKAAVARQKELDEAAITGASGAAPPHEVESPFIPEPAPPAALDPDTEPPMAPEEPPTPPEEPPAGPTPGAIPGVTPP